MHHLTQDQARGHILKRHGLSEPYATPLEALHATFGIQVQYALSLPTALAFRVKNLKTTWHKKEEHQSVLKSWTLRSTLHAHTSEDHAIVLAALRDRLRTRYVEWFKNELGYTDKSLARLEEDICSALGGKPLTRPELHDKVPAMKDIPYAGWGMDLKGLAYSGRLKLIVTDGGPTRFALHDCPSEWPKDEAIAELMRRYFYAYGPATLTDFRFWTGLFATDVNRAFTLAEPDLEQVEVEGMAGNRYVYGGIAEGRTPKTKLLAKFDPLTLGHSDKTMFLPLKDRTKVFRIAGQVEAGVLVDGRFVGTWRLNRKGKGSEVVVEPFRKIAKARLPALEREARKAAKSLGLSLTELRITG